jgi:hypothetical protein
MPRRVIDPSNYLHRIEIKEGVETHVFFCIWSQIDSATCTYRIIWQVM